MPDPAPPPPPGDLERTLKQSADAAEAARAASQEADVEGPLKPPKIPGYQVMEPIGRGAFAGWEVSRSGIPPIQRQRHPWWRIKMVYHPMRKRVPELAPAPPLVANE